MPNPPRRPGSSSKINVVEVNAATGRHEYTGPAPSECRPPYSNRPPAELPPPLPSFRREPPEDNPSNALPRARPERHATLTGMPAPPSEPPPQREKLDSREISTDAILAEFAAKAEEARAAKAERDRLAVENERLRAPKETSHARGPTISLGDGRWWFLVITALLGSGGLSALIVKWHELDRPTASQAQVTDVKQDVQESAEQAKKRADAEKADREAADQRARVTAAFLCAQGLRADGLECDALLQEIEFAPQPLHPRGPLLWKTRAKWPRIRDPPSNYSPPQ